MLTSTSIRTTVLVVSTMMSFSGLATAGEDRKKKRVEPRGVLLNKPKIAEETYGKLRGLRELDNPHLREGLLLRKLQVDPVRNQVDLEALHAARIRDIEERQGRREGIPAEVLRSHRMRLPAVELTRAAGRQGLEPSSGRGGWTWVILSMGCVVLMIGVLVRATR